CLLLSRFYVVPDNSTVLRFSVYGVRIGWVDCRIKSVSSDCDVPVTACNSLPVACLAGARPAVIVLKTAIHVVERLTVVSIDGVVLRNWKIADEIHRLAAVVGDVHTAVIAN